MTAVAVVGPAFLDLTFEGLDELPAPGQERYASALHATPGGAAITAIGLARLGVDTALVAPVGRDLPGAMLRERLEAEGILLAGPDAERTPVTVVLPVGDDRSFVTFEPPATLDPTAIERLGARAVVVGIRALALVPDGVEAYVTVGDEEADCFAGRLPPGLARARALLANRSEAQRLTGEATADGAALTLAESVGTAIVTCGAEGAVAAAGGTLCTASAPLVEARDTTGAGDLFAAAYVWGDLQGLPLAERLRRAAVYAALSVRTATGAGSAATFDELERALELDPAIVQPVSAKEDA
jgi:ribokinase